MKWGETDDARCVTRALNGLSVRVCVRVCGCRVDVQERERDREMERERERERERRGRCVIFLPGKIGSKSS